MPYYQCPKCSGRDTYEGTELVSGSKRGGTFVGSENDLGFSPVVGTGGESTTNEQTVVKCKTCDIILGQKDFHLTAEDIRKQQLTKKKKRRVYRKAEVIFSAIGATIILLIFGSKFYNDGKLDFILPSFLDKFPTT